MYKPHLPVFFQPTLSATSAGLKPTISANESAFITLDLHAREPERRKVGTDARISVEVAAYEVDPYLAGEHRLLLWGMFDNELHIAFEGERTGPYYPVAGPIPQNRFRAFRKGTISQKAERIATWRNNSACLSPY